ncbi:hypothetical protein RI367_003221 [Sorochytrium milnesiophthora]
MPPQQPQTPSPPNPVVSFITDLPVVTRALFVTTIAFTLLGNFIVSPNKLVLVWPLVIRKLQLWRLLSCFFFGKLGFPWVFGLYFLYQHSLDLERTRFAGRTADYAFFISFVAVLSLIGDYFFNFMILSEPLMMAVVYLWAQEHAGQTVTFMFGVRFKAIYLPWVLVVWDVLISGGVSISKLMGIVVSHIFYYLHDQYPALNNGRVVLSTPSFFRKIFPEAGVRVGGFAPGGAVNITAEGTAPGQRRMGYTWGRGQRLGE